MNNANGGSVTYHFKGDTKDLDNTTSRLKGSLKGLVQGIGLGLGAAAMTATTEIVTLATMGVKSFANLEQSIGGIETLFGDSADAVIKNAKRAYKTAGLSANQYMETTTSFAASLLQSLGGDTAKAVDYADRAITDMSDNANKMGTDMSMIQNAYQGFAKQNYTMLDNLKLGYGGTKTEMERLISDASKMTDVQKELNVSVKEGDTSFGNIVNAISVMQKKMKITGTTSKEAASTISGSINSMRAAWDNFLNGSGTGQELADTLITAFENISNKFIDLLPGIIDGLTELTLQLVPKIPEIINKLLPSLISGAVQLVKSLAIALPTILNEVLKGAGTVIKSLAAALPTLIPQIVEAILGLIPVLIDNLPLFIEAGLQLIIGLAKGIIMSIPTLLEKAWEIITKLVDAFLSLPGKLWDIGVDLIKGLWEGIKSVGAWLWDKVSGFLGDLFGGILSFFGIGSPSKLLRDEVGQWIPKGMAVGITANVDSVTGAMDDMNKQILTEAQANSVVESMFDVQPNISGQMTSAYSPNIVVNVQNNMETDPLGQLVNNVKTFSGGAKNDYNWGAAV